MSPGEKDRTTTPEGKARENLPELADGMPIGEIARAIRSIAYGSVEIIIQDSRVIQINKTEKKRISYKTETDYSI